MSRTPSSVEAMQSAAGLCRTLDHLYHAHLTPQPATKSLKNTPTPCGLSHTCSSCSFLDGIYTTCSSFGSKSGSRPMWVESHLQALTDRQSTGTPHGDQRQERSTPTPSTTSTTHSNNSNSNDLSIHLQQCLQTGSEPSPALCNEALQGRLARTGVRVSITAYLYFSV